jgi:uncharacterized protein DUF3485
MLRSLPVIIAFAFLISSGLVHGIWTERWEKSEALQNACARVEQVPLTIGAWQGKDLTVNPEEFALAGAETYWMRSYTNNKNQTVTVLLMCGRAGRMSVHTPEICYQGLGYQIVDTATRQEIDFSGSAKGEFWTARFVKETGSGSDLRLFWGWSVDGVWKAPSSPRWEFRGRPFLYKLYVVHNTARQQRLEEEPGVEFLRQCLPVLEKVLFSGNSG